ncbi:hypothetical protein GCM10020219_067570 [Nonomuraea dietziae]
MHPGSILTPLQRHIPREEQLAQGWITSEGEPAPGFKTPAQGAATAVGPPPPPCSRGTAERTARTATSPTPPPATTCSSAGSSPGALDPAQAARLWDLSSELTGLNAFA